MPQLSSQQRNGEWDDARHMRITASRAAACLNLDPHCSPQKAYRIITGLETMPDNPYMAWGREREQEAIGAYEAETGVLVTPTGFWVHPEHDWLGASPDGLIGEDGLLEVKCPRELPVKVPMHHRVQVQVQLLVTGRQYAVYYAWTPDGFMAEVVERDSPEIMRDLLEKLASFYVNYIAAGVEPPRRNRRKQGVPEGAGKEILPGALPVVQWQGDDDTDCFP